MKNLLSENMLRFGTKNLTPNQQRELVAKSIMETINQHGLANVIKKKLNEQPDPAELKASGMDGGTMKQIGALTKQGGVGQKNLGIAMKIAGQIMGATRGAFNHDPNKIASALKLIKQNGGKTVYDSLLWYVSKSADFKQKEGQNFPLVIQWIGDYFGKQTTSYDEEPSSSQKWLQAYESILQVYNRNEISALKSQSDWTLGGTE